MALGDPGLSSLLPSDPLFKFAEVAAYRETLVRERVNDAALATMLAYAEGSDLDQIGARYNVVRLQIAPGNPSAVPPVPPTMETDTDFRLRIQQSFEGLSVAGPAAAYRFHAMSADPDVLHVGVSSPNPAEVLVVVLARSGDGTASGGLLAAVASAINDESVRPIGDRVTVQSAAIVSYAITAQLVLADDADGSLVLAASQAAVEAMVQARRRVGVLVPLSAIYAALTVEGVQAVNLTSPVADVAVTGLQASYCSAITVSIAP
jgi:phage-related baseplate assembly protein